MRKNARNNRLKTALKLAAGLLVASLALLLSSIRGTAPLSAGEARFIADGGDYVSVEPKMIELRFSVAKPEKEYRVFLVGGSVLMGTPYVHQSSRVMKFFFGLLTLTQTGGIATWLEEYLAALYPERKIRVINAAMGSSNLDESYRVFEEVAEKGKPDVVLLMESEAPGLPDSGGLESDATKAAGARASDRVLREVAALAEKRKVTTYFLTTPRNLADWQPAGGENGPAMRAYMKALHYHSLGQARRAKELYQLAAELDPAGRRTRPSQNRLMAARARGRHVRFMDLDAFVCGLAKDGIPGREQFHDDSHLRLAVNQAAALALAKRLAADDPTAAGRAALLEKVQLSRLDPRGLRALLSY